MFGLYLISCAAIAAIPSFNEWKVEYVLLSVCSVAKSPTNQRAIMQLVSFLGVKWRNYSSLAVPHLHTPLIFLHLSAGTLEPTRPPLMRRMLLLPSR
jgi:hypothetical protein